MSDGPAWTAVAVSILALGVSGAAFARGESRARREERRVQNEESRRAAIGPADVELRAALVDIRSLFVEIEAHGGVDSDWLMDESRKRSGQRLQDHAPRVGDPRLRSMTEEIAKTWDLVFAHSPPPQGPRAFNLGAPYPEHYRQQDLERDKRLAEEAEVARRGEEQCGHALDRLNELER